MSKRGDRERLMDILEAIDRAITYTANMSYEDFLGDAKTQDATIRALEILGEASKEVSEPIKAQYPTIPWRSIAGQRDKLIHHYFGVNLDIVWETITLDLPNFRLQINQVLMRFSEV
ncbi:DUF86 domain-containing protein [Limnothrix sp. FACHB-1083]|uniref:HepT-like ribonuclease domain-containing protein n=1 Tax=unclassified Limnothrix TaxID=2632864 RepID=UPI00168070B2|nr:MULTISPECIES: DUF86 domain-containing protein [unclassified Limnothrix]MBD2162701.1 DUF86 domain-containing protein [Limnothrix sp. FACHB-1083]MBD2193773.1 DUF86 domain-containing protein [Limnothrix sp. FACHB-1088]